MTLIPFFICLFVVNSWAGPHLKVYFNKSLFSTFEVKVLVVVLTLLSVPFLYYAFRRKQFKTRNTLKLLKQLAVYDPNFDWVVLKKHITEVVTGMFEAWNKADKTAIFAYCTLPFWMEQQLVNLNYWEEEGLIKKSRLHQINRLAPILVRHSGLPQAEESILVVDLKAIQEDCLQEKDTKQTVQGKPGFQEVETLWTFQLYHGKWLLHNIEHTDFLSVYTGLTNVAPETALRPPGDKTA